MQAVDAGLPVKDFTLYFAWTQDFVQKGGKVLADARAQARVLLIASGAAFLLSLACFILLLVYTGRRRADGTRRLYALDRVFMEVQAVAMIVIGIIGIEVLAELLSAFRDPSYGGSMDLPGFVLFSLALVLWGAVLLWLALSLVRNLKAGLFVRRMLLHLLVARPLGALFAELRKGFNGQNPLAKTILLVVLAWGATGFFTLLALVTLDTAESALFFLFIAFVALPALALWLSLRWVRRYGRLKTGVEELAEGNLKYRIPVDGRSPAEFDRLAERINRIGAATDIAVQNELKNQRLKTDLISNVSHDLKTPLTSMITYTDLLKKEGLDGARAAEYLQVIEDKVHRLKKLTDDLFDAAKASSGAIPVRMGRVDVRALIGQELAEFGDTLAEQELEVIVSASQEHYYVHADSQLLWRVVDNLLNNVRKYALPGSRVYIDLEEQEEGEGAAKGHTTLAIKNISSVRLNIPAEELMERFRRGDESRATDGSGLGLAIANDLMRLMGGSFEIYVDGDLFKATATLRRQ
jgi:signal transduction histidine kinase